MKTIKNGIKTEQMVDDSDERRYLLKIDWNKEKSRACVIMLSPGSMNGISYDRTTNFVLENLVRLDYGGVEIVNLFSNVDSKTEKYDDDVNMDIIDASAKRCDIIIFATGASYKTNKTILGRQNDVLEMLKDYEDKMYCITDSNGERFYHPLCPKVRIWNLESFGIDELLDE